MGASFACGDRNGCYVSKRISFYSSHCRTESHLDDSKSGTPILPASTTIPATEAAVAQPIALPNSNLETLTLSEKSIQTLALYLLIAYIIGVGFVLSRFTLSIIGSFRLRQTIQPITDSNLLRMIAEQCAIVGLRRVPLVAICQRVSVPVVVGIIKPMILLPPTLLCGLDPNQIAAILSHEMAHIRRHDLIVNLLQRVVEALLFFHPVTWWISRCVSMERENCCDEVAASFMGRITYAQALLQMAEICLSNHRSRSQALATLAADGGNSTDFGYRIRRLINAQETPQFRVSKRSLAFGLALVVLMGASLVSLAQTPQAKKTKTG